MKKLNGFLVVAVLGIIVSSLCLADAEVVAVSSVKLSVSRFCGTPGRPGSGAPPCMTSVRISYNAATSGSCEGFAAKGVPSETGPGTIITITKSRQPNCTRPEHPQKFEAQSSAVFTNSNTQEPYYLSNPLAVNN